MNLQEDPHLTKDPEEPFDLANFKDTLDKHIAKQLAEQSVKGALVFGGIAAILGALLWATFIVITDLRIGFAAIGLAYLVGFAVRKGGKGITTKFNIIGAALSLSSYFLGDYFKGVAFTARMKDISCLEAVSEYPISYAVPFMFASLTPIDLLFYAIVGYFGYRFSN